MPEYAIFVSLTGGFFSDLFWNIRHTWGDIPFGKELAIVLAVVFLAFMLLRVRK